MQIDPKKCVGCGNCLPVCPMGAIAIDPRTRRARVNADECVECFACYRGMSKEHLNPTFVRTVRRVLGWFRVRFDPEPDICPTDAIVPQELTWPRIVRRAFSDPLVPHESTGVHGRGTEEVKTNDVTGRVQAGEAGFVVEFGRPGVGVRFREVQQVTRMLARLEVGFEPRNPVTSLMRDPAKGELREDILTEKLLSAIVEFKTTLDRVPELVRALEAEAKGLDTVLALGVSARCGPDGSEPLADLLGGMGHLVYRGKTNLGLGRPAPAARGAA
ncbi:MAG: 4Fe-4S binding protein [Deltaproteobacteria bacterium]|nr:4Fe-4S binding protein [Deltaproteobacteria bacterium]